MDAKQLDVDCPCCKSRLAVDVRTSRVVRWAPPEELDEAGRPVVREERWQEVRDRALGRRAEASDRFDEALRKEQNREAELDELFRKARKKADD